MNLSSWAIDHRTSPPAFQEHSFTETSYYLLIISISKSCNCPGKHPFCSTCTCFPLFSFPPPVELLVGSKVDHTSTVSYEGLCRHSPYKNPPNNLNTRPGKALGRQAWTQKMQMCVFIHGTHSNTYKTHMCIHTL